jgi:hypothetical protein
MERTDPFARRLRDARRQLECETRAGRQVHRDERSRSSSSRSRISASSHTTSSTLLAEPRVEPANGLGGQVKHGCNAHRTTRSVPA